ncbi:MAG: exodeoxyribonuclease V subunit beta [Desulfobulbaceae bacterium]|nr:exodeoxyribonuclease V subunit beta [Desulfobulbaceae bacterium]
MVEGPGVSRGAAAIPPFQVLTAPLLGTMLIDASAGTGKTYTIAALMVRLLLERGLDLKEILVVTFTEAAAEDLRDRIRQGIKKAAQAFASGQAEDAFLQGLLLSWPEHSRAAARLNLLLRNFDEAAVFTIHGFCQRVLAEHSLETGVLFDSELVTDLRELLQRILEDFFRTSFYDDSSLVVGYCLKSFSPEALRKRLGNLYAREDIEVRPQLAGATIRRALVQAEEEYRAVFARLAAAWPARRQAVREFLLESGALKGNQYRPDAVPCWLASLDALLARSEPPLEFFDKFAKFTQEGLEAALKKGFAAPAEPFFAHCGELQAAQRRLGELLAQYALWLESGVPGYVRRELAQRKAAAGAHSFDDLLSRLLQALRSPTGPALAENLRRQYRAVLIDEFQDTDPEQYEIFTTAFDHPDSLLYLIGDPKQAIYSFRGADIFAYIRAVRSIAARFTLLDNWRSVPGLITAVNTIFAGAAQPFIFPEIIFSPAQVADKEHDSFVLSGVAAPPLLLRVARRAESEGAKPISKEAAGRLILGELAGEIGELLALGHEGRARLGEKALAARDIAVLVRTNHQAREVQAALAQVGVASVLNGSESLFVSREAVELGIVLRAVAECGNSRRLRAALATRLLAVPAAELDLLREEADLDGWFTRFRVYHELWEANGFVRMFGEFLDREGVRERLLALPDGERALTNVLHLQEVLHGAAGQRLGMTGLLKYLHDLISAAAANPAEELQLRLASDAELVQIITIHKAKGLQYPVVFCPFSWEGSPILAREKRLGQEAPRRYLFHEATATDYRLVLDLGSAQQAASRELALREELAENLRLLYVALTRAINRCYLFWGPFASAGTSAAAYLLHGARFVGEGGTPAWESDPLAGLTDSDLMADLHVLCRQSGGTVGLEVLGEAARVPARRGGVERKPVGRRVFRGRCRDDWRVESYSSLHRLREGENPERWPLVAKDLGARPAEIAGDFADLAKFPAGAGPGTFLHALLEEVDFAGGVADRPAFLREKLRIAGFDQRWAPVLDNLLSDLLHTPLTAADSSLILARIGKEARLTELEFYFPLAATDPARLERLFTQGGAPSAGPQSGLVGVRPEGLRGMLKGFIDLVFHHGGRFYLLDWKSNYLGAGPEAYAESRLPEVMVRDGYNLQYLIYAVALHLYLARRLPGYSYDEHFGGVFYLFLRGVRRQSGPSQGIFRARPGRELIAELAACLTGVMYSELTE